MMHPDRRREIQPERRDPLYLKKRRRKDGLHYILSESYCDRDCWKHRNLLDLGANPEDFIEYPGGNSFYVSQDLQETLDTKGVKYSDDALEKLFIPFLNPEIRRVVEMFERPGKDQRPRETKTDVDMLDQQNNLHPFDKRRLHYLRCGRVDIGNLDGRTWKFLHVLLEKSRDEIESMMTSMEGQLPPHEIRPYLYTALQLQTYFIHNPVCNSPAGLDPERVDHYFVEDLCRLNIDETFFRGVDRGDTDTLHTYLVRYLILYFDNDFDRGTVWDEYVRDFISKRRFHRPNVQKGMALSEKAACKCMGITPQEWKNMDRHALTRRYRQLAKETHPDRGGDGEAFVSVKDAYECLLAKKT